MRYFNRFNAPAIEILQRNEAFGVTKISLPKGEGKVSKDDFEILLQSEMVRSYVMDGYLEFPDSAEMGAIYNSKRDQRMAREKELYGEPDAPADATAEGLGELTDLVGKQAAELADTKAYLADAQDMNAKLAKRLEALEAKDAKAEAKAAAKVEAKTAPTSAPAPAPVAETPAPAPIVAPVAVAPVIAPVAVDAAPPPPPAA